MVYNLIKNYLVSPSLHRLQTTKSPSSSFSLFSLIPYFSSLSQSFSFPVSHLLQKNETFWYWRQFQFKLLYSCQSWVNKFVFETFTFNFRATYWVMTRHSFTFTCASNESILVLVFQQMYPTNLANVFYWNLTLQNVLSNQ